MLVVKWLRWFLVPSGIVCVEESGKISWLAAFRRLFSGGVARRPDGPIDQDFVGYVRIGLDVKRYKCRVCSVYFWSWKKRKVCYKWSCCKRRISEHRTVRVVSERKTKGER